MLDRGGKFWIALAVFQLLFGLAIFLVTRQYYLAGADSVDADLAAAARSLSEWPDSIGEAGPPQFGSRPPDEVTFDDPGAISRRADEHFVKKEYERAAALYERLLVLAPGNIDAYNNLGLTLHYLGRSTEALGRLNEGVTMNPEYQRIWLTLGYVNSQLGNVDQARSALTRAARMAPDNEVGQSAQNMLENLP